VQPVRRGAGENQHCEDDASWVKSAGQSPNCARHLGPDATLASAVKTT